MRVAVDAHNLLTDRRGIGVYLREILRIWIERDACELTLLVRHPFPSLLRRRLRVEIELPKGLEKLRLRNRVPKDCDVCWHPWNGTFFSGAGKNVATVHDVTPFALPDPDPQKRAHQQEPFLRTAATANALITDSQFSKSEIVRYLQYPAERITVIPLAAGKIFTADNAVEKREPYILFVGGDEPRKNLATLEDAYHIAFSSGGPKLVTIRGGISEEQLRDAYRGALCVAVPSTYEGFGLPALEGMACGTPVIASRTASLPEVCGDTALYVDSPSDVNEWAAALRRISMDGMLRYDLSKRGIARAAQFSWERTASGVMEVLARNAAGTTSA